ATTVPGTPFPRGRTPTMRHDIRRLHRRPNTRRHDARRFDPRPLASFAAVVLALAGCGGKGGQPAGDKAPLKVGISLSLSGDFADPGKAAQRGYQLWADTVNAKGGVLGRQV